MQAVLCGFCFRDYHTKFAQVPLAEVLGEASLGAVCGAGAAQVAPISFGPEAAPEVATIGWEDQWAILLCQGFLVLAPASCNKHILPELELTCLLNSLPGRQSESGKLAYILGHVVFLFGLFQLLSVEGRAFCKGLGGNLVGSHAPHNCNFFFFGDASGEVAIISLMTFNMGDSFDNLGASF